MVSGKVSTRAVGGEPLAPVPRCECGRIGFIQPGQTLRSMNSDKVLARQSENRGHRIEVFGEVLIKNGPGKRCNCEQVIADRQRTLHHTKP